MCKPWIRITTAILCTVVCCLMAPAAAQAQKSTEMFIPIGKSPGLSGTKTVVGSIVSVDAEKQEIVLSEEAGNRTVYCTKDTSIWLDRSQQKLPNRVGTITDCHEASYVEVKFVDNDKDLGHVEWIKVEVAEE